MSDAEFDATTEALIERLNDAFVASNRAEFMDADRTGGEPFDQPILDAVQQIANEARARALTDARDDIKARITTFRALDADPQYMNALNDAWGLVANRVRACVTPPVEPTCTCEHYVVDHSDPEPYHPENVDREDDPNCPVHRADKGDTHD